MSNKNIKSLNKQKPTFSSLIYEKIKLYKWLILGIIICLALIWILYSFTEPKLPNASVEVI